MSLQNLTVQMPKYKKELRQTIADEVNSCKNVFGLRDMYAFVNLMRRYFGGDEEFNELTDTEKEISLMTTSLLFCEDAAKLRCARIVLMEILYPRRREEL